MNYKVTAEQVKRHALRRGTQSYKIIKCEEFEQSAHFDIRGEKVFLVKMCGKTHNVDSQDATWQDVADWMNGDTVYDRSMFDT